jgi:YggT family protein
MSSIASSLSIFLWIYSMMLIVRVLLTWFPTINWSTPPFSILSELTDPYLNLFRRIIPPIGGFDLSPILALFVLQFVSRAIAGIA